MKHFKLTSESMLNHGLIKLFRIQATKDSLHAKKGDLGGWIEKEENLHGNAWVYDSAQVYGNAKVSGNARVSGNAKVSGNARVSGKAWVLDNARVYDNSEVYDYAEVHGYAEVYGYAKVYGYAHICDRGKAYGYGQVYSNAHVGGNAIICRYGRIESNNDYCCFQNFGFENRCTTFFKQQDNSIRVSCGCFTGSIQEFEKQVITTHAQNKHAKEYLTMIEMAKIKFGL